ncbi:MAG: hypothetical protein HYS13_11955 [Planctomycetia bacterium]|nr:hypothetical protein [Planctomycetia bacterium]
MATKPITHRRLPHWYVLGAAHFVTYRLDGMIPGAVVGRLKARTDELLRRKPPPGVTASEYRTHIHKLVFAEYDDYLDSNRKIRWLADARVAATIRSNLYHHHGAKYYLLAYCVMPNHVHVLLQPIVAGARSVADAATQPVGESDDGHSRLAKIMHSLKSYTAHEANRILKRSGTFWQQESYDHWVRDDGELERIVNYIRANPGRAGLAKQPHEWFFCSCHDRYLMDGDDSGWLYWSDRTS